VVADAASTPPPGWRSARKGHARAISSHPQPAALLGNLGWQGESVQAQLGPLPSWAQAEGLFPVGGDRRFPLVVNPASAGVLSQPAQLAAEIASFAGLAPQSSGYAARQSFSPFIDALLTSITGKDAFGRDVGTGATSFGRELYSGDELREVILGVLTFRAVGALSDADRTQAVALLAAAHGHPIHGETGPPDHEEY
jgi:hypothetical protein